LHKKLLILILGIYVDWPDSSRAIARHSKDLFEYSQDLLYTDIDRPSAGTLTSFLFASMA